MAELAAMKGLNKITAEMNAAFAAADDAGKRVIIAQDVIAALKAQRLIAESGVYLNINGDWADHVLKGSLLEGLGATPESSFQDLLPSLPPCEVCAKGAIFVCTVARRNQVTVGEAFRPTSKWGGSDMEPMLGGLFGAEQLALIEREFEGHANDEGVEDMSVMGLFEHGENDDGDEICNQLFDDSTRMTLIMENIIKNGGTFVPEDGVA